MKFYTFLEYSIICPKKIVKFEKLQIFIAKSIYKAKNVLIATYYTFLKSIQEKLKMCKFPLCNLLAFDIGFTKIQSLELGINIDLAWCR